MRLTLSMLVVTAGLSAQAEESAELKTVEGTGQAAVVAGNEQKAVDEAKKAALRSALEQAAGVVVTADTATRNGQLVMDRVIAKSEGYIRSSEVVSKKLERDVMTVVVKAQVGVKALEKDLVAIRGIVDRLGRSKLIIVVQENSIDDKGVSSRSEIVPAEMTKIFRADGWTIIDEKAGGDTMTVTSGVGVGKLDPKEIARKGDVDYVIYGSVNIRYVPPSKGMAVPEVDDKGNQLVFVVTADYDLAMQETRTGRQLAKVAGKFNNNLLYKIQKNGSYSQTAINFTRLEAPRIIDELRAAAIETLRQQDVNGAAVTVEVSGVPDLDTVDDLERALGTVQGVQTVKMNGDFKDGKVEFEVAFLGTSRELGKAVSASTFKKKKLVVKAVMNNRVEVALGR